MEDIQEGDAMVFFFKKEKEMDSFPSPFFLWICVWWTRSWCWERLGGGV